MAALLDKVQSTEQYSPIPLRARRQQGQPQARPKQDNSDTSRGTSSRQPAPTTPYTQVTTDGLVEEHLPQTETPDRTGNRFKRLTGRLYPYTYRPQSGKMQAKQAHGKAWLVLLGWFLSGGWFAVLSRIVTLLVIVYTVVFFLVLGCSAVSNTWNYGPTHTAYLTATINGSDYTIQTSNQGGTIYVTITNQQDGSSRTYTGPKLNPAGWNGDMDSIVATAAVRTSQGQHVILVTLTGNINYFRPFFVRPQTTFTLHPTREGGYTITQP